MLRGQAGDRPHSGVREMKGHHLLLGGAGFVGRHVALLLAESGYRVTIASRHNMLDRMPPILRERVRWQVLELGSADWDKLVEDADVVHHYAWGSIPASANANPRGDLLTNVGATIDCLDALRRRGQGRVLFASSGGTVYGKVQLTPVPETHPLVPVTAYGAGKVTAEVYLNLYRLMYGIDCRVARVANPYGAGQDLSKGLGAVTTFLHCALANDPIMIWGNGDVVRDYIHISDIAKGLVKLATLPTLSEFTFNMGSGHGISLNEIVSEIESQLGRTLDVSRTETRAFDVPVSILSIDRAKDILSWTPSLSFSDGIARTLRDLKQGRSFSTMD